MQICDYMYIPISYIWHVHILCVHKVKRDGKLHFKGLFSFSVHVCATGCIYVHPMHTVPLEAKIYITSLSWSWCCRWMWIIQSPGNQIQSSAGAVSTLNCWGVSPAPENALKSDILTMSRDIDVWYISHLSVSLLSEIMMVSHLLFC